MSNLVAISLIRKGLSGENDVLDFPGGKIFSTSLNLLPVPDSELLPKIPTLHKPSPWSGVEELSKSMETLKLTGVFILGVGGDCSEVHNKSLGWTAETINIKI